jgi:hypothetical protein
MAPPPGYVPYGGSGVAMGPFSRVGGVATALAIVQAISVVTGLALLLFQVSLVQRANDFLDDTISLGDFEDRLGPFIAISAVAGLVSIAALVLLIIWSYRIAQNLQRLGRPITWKPGLTIVVWLLGGCTLSIINFLMLREHWRGSDPEVAPHDPSYTSRPVSPLIVGWFVLSLAQVVLSGASGARSFGGVRVGNDTQQIADSLSDRLPLVLAAGACSLAATVVLVLIIRRLTARHLQAIGEA